MKKTISTHTFGPWALVTGASSGIGEEFARQLAAQGLNLVLVARRQSLLEKLGSHLAQQYGIQYRVLGMDLATEGSVESLIEATSELDVGLLISNAGTGRPGKFLSRTLNDLMGIIQLNALSHLRLTHHFGQRLSRRGRGGIVLTGAMGATQGVPYMATESGTKALIEGLGKALHTEFGPTGVHVTVLKTSPTETPVLAALGFTADTLPATPVSAAQCVRETLRALQANRASIIPGRKYRVMHALLPGSLSRRFMGNTMKRNNNIK